MSACCPDNNLNCFHWISIFCGICITWVKILDGIEDGHHTALNVHIMADHVTLAFLGFLESISQLEPSNLVRDLKGTCDISSRFCQIPICVFFNFFTHFLISLAAHS